MNLQGHPESRGVGRYVACGREVGVIYHKSPGPSTQRNSETQLGGGRNGRLGIENRHRKTM